MKRSNSFSSMDHNNVVKSKKFINSLFLKTKNNKTKIHQKYLLKNIIQSNNLKFRSFSFNDVKNLSKNKFRQNTYSKETCSGINKTNKYEKNYYSSSF